MKLKQLDLFSGIGGFHLGFEKAGFEIESYFSEIDKYAIDVYKNNFKNSKYVGSVTDVRGKQLPKIDLITFGSPCQDFSLAGKRRGMQGARSSLISEAIRLIGECRPSVFIWENVKGTFSSNNGNDFWAIIQTFANIGGYRIEWQLLNTSWFLPQNRERIYLVGYSTKQCRGQVFPISENNRQVNETRANPDSLTITTRYAALTSQGSYINECNKISQEKIEVGTWRTYKDKRGFEPRTDLVSPTISARAREDGSGQPVIKVISGTKKGFEKAKHGDSINLAFPGSTTKRGRVGKKQSQTLDTACNMGVYTDNKKVTHNCLTEAIGRQGSSSEYITSLNKINESTGIIRRLTPIECERLQGFPDDLTKIGLENGEISDSQRYKMCGNAVTVDVVESIAKKIKLNIL